MSNTENNNPATENLSIAEALAVRFVHGQNFSDSNGVDLYDALYEVATAYPHPTDHGIVRHEMVDGSAIITTDGAWDVGFSDIECECHCFTGVGHHECTGNR